MPSRPARERGGTVGAAQTVELGLTHSPVVAPSCPATIAPSDCRIVLTRSTALETIRDAVDYPTTATASGEIVAFTLGLSGLSTNQKTAHSEIQGLDAAYGGTTQAAVAVLKPVGAHRHFQWQLQAVSPVVHLQPYRGVIAVPAGVAAADRRRRHRCGERAHMGAGAIDRAPREVVRLQTRSRTANSWAGTANQSMFTLQVTSVFGCDYTGTRVEYTATEITSPVPAKVQVH